MLEIRYNREMNHNYMIIDSPEEDLCGYECRMLAGNRIEGLLKFRIRYRDEKKEFYYEITSRQPLKRLYDQKTIKGREIRKLLLDLSAILNKAEEYLLREEQILLDPEYIYVDPEPFSIHLCMVPGYSCDFPAAVTKLLRFMLEKVDHQDRDGVVLAYNLYQESLKENYGMLDLLRYLGSGEERIFEDRDRRPEREGSGMDPGTAEREEPPGQERYPEPDERPVRPQQKDKRSVRPQQKDDRPARPQQKDDRPARPQQKDGGEPGKTSGKKLLSGLAESVLLTAGGLAALWFFAGEEIFFRYGVPLGFLLFALLWLPGFVLHKKNAGRGREREQEEYGRVREAREKDIATRSDRESFRISFEEEPEPAVAQPPDPAKDGAEEDGKVGTTLLAELFGRDSPAVLESLSRDRENIEIGYVPFIIGKHAEMADYYLRQPTVSRLHLRVDRKEGVYIVTDLNTTNGTTVDGYHLQANETVSVKDGDLIYLADVGYRFLDKRN